MKFSVLLPGSLLADCPNLLHKTIKTGVVGRALAVFRVERVIVYDDGHPASKKDAKVITRLLEYMETPQYLRKILFKSEPQLRYAGILPPLRTPHHPLAGEKEAVGDVREAVVLMSTKDGSILELGLPQKGFIAEKLKAGQRVTVKLVLKRKNEIVVQHTSPQEYWGYTVEYKPNIKDALEAVGGDLKVGTSRYGRPLAEVQAQLLTEAKKRGGMALAFGGPYTGLYEICGDRVSTYFDFLVNTIPGQGTSTVRTEEALTATLAIFNFLLR
ncbi:MAG: putative RNA uridine N3 methyltransferase [Candidatus Hadarchaeales archaeon]